MLVAMLGGAAGVVVLRAASPAEEAGPVAGVTVGRTSSRRYRYLVSPDLEAVLERELALLTPDVRTSVSSVHALLHPDFLEYGASGRVWNLTDITEATTQTPEGATATGLEAVRLAPDVVLVRYLATSPERRSRRSSIWVRCSQEWLLLFHQGTPFD